MAVTHRIKKDQTEPSGRRRVWYEFTHVESGLVLSGGVTIMPAGADADAEGVRCAAKVEPALKEDDRGLLSKKVERYGIDPNDVPLRILTRAQARRFLVRRMMNLARRVRNDEEPEALFRLQNLARRLSGLTNAQIANITGWPQAKVAAARSKIASLIAAVDDTDHGESDLDEGN